MLLLQHNVNNCQLLRLYQCKKNTTKKWSKKSLFSLCLHQCLQNCKCLLLNIHTEALTLQQIQGLSACMGELSLLWLWTETKRLKAWFGGALHARLHLGIVEKYIYIYTCQNFSYLWITAAGNLMYLIQFWKMIQDLYEAMNSVTVVNVKL